MKSIKILFVLFFLLSTGMSAQQKADYSKEIGYFDFRGLACIKNLEPSTEVYLEEPMLKMIGKMTDEKGEGISKMIAGLKLIQVNEFELDTKEISSCETTIESLDNGLQSKQWERIIRTKHKNSYDNVYVHRDKDGEFAGLVIISMHVFVTDSADRKGKISFVNIVGKVDLNSLGALSKEFNLPGFGKEKQKEK